MKTDFSARRVQEHTKEVDGLRHVPCITEQTGESAEAKE